MGRPSSLALPEIHWMKQRDNEAERLADVDSDADTASHGKQNTQIFIVTFQPLLNYRDATAFFFFIHSEVIVI